MSLGIGLPQGSSLDEARRAPFESRRSVFTLDRQAVEFLLHQLQQISEPVTRLDHLERQFTTGHIWKHRKRRWRTSSRSQSSGTRIELVQASAKCRRQKYEG